MSTEPGIDGFLAGLRRLGVGARREADLIIFTVTAASGSLAGIDIETGVSATELAR